MAFTECLGDLVFLSILAHGTKIVSVVIGFRVSHFKQDKKH